jgi:hypothetical protein
LPRQRAETPEKCRYFKDAISGVHRRRRAMRVMVMAMMETRQHPIVTVREPSVSVNNFKQLALAIF